MSQQLIQQQTENQTQAKYRHQSEMPDTNMEQ